MNQPTKNVAIVTGGVVILIIAGMLISKINFSSQNSSINQLQNNASTTEATTTTDLSQPGQLSPKQNSSQSTQNQSVSISEAVNSNNKINTYTDTQVFSSISNSHIRVPSTGADVWLKNGYAEFVYGNVSGHVTLGPVIGKVVTNDGDDIFLDMTLSTDKTTEVNHYLAVFNVNGTLVKYSSSLFIGSRLSFQSVSALVNQATIIKGKQNIMNSTIGYILTVNYLSLNDGEPVTAAPSVPRSITVHVKNHIITN